ncbi:MAG: Adenylate cyclase [uncultured Gemmatimonadetes bacterium]|uniref:Adenylate cyclase n=1 Tax=uncultured Gemmatimonadota bacterium TaxID=203437 RepID=A0A6J4M783_9BACT|nr:MAG: Adenylate cyclase [uncultured Gemmatimonadota bacterium]
MIDLDQIKQRKLFQWAFAYLAGAWLILQVLGLLAQPFAWPDLVLRAATVLLGIGFFAVLILAWYHGEQGRQKASGVELLMLAGILMIAGVAVALVSRGGKDGSPGAALSAGAAAPGGLAAAPATEQGSIAVLPFVNMSPDKDQEYFSDGLTEELLNVLAKIPALRVAARTSSFSFKGKNLPVDSVARALKVGHVLEGSVRKAGDQVRITAQLIDAKTGFHLWSETYDRSLKDIFAVQDEISKAVAEQLRLKLAPGETLARQETTDPEAHTLVLRGIAAHRQGTRESFAEAERLFRQAIQRDPRYAQAHARLASSLMVRAYHRHIPVEAGYAQARTSAERALALDPKQSEAHSVLGRIADTHDWNFAAAEAHFERALEANPGDARARSLRAWLLMRLGKSEEAVRAARRATELDPLSMAAYNNLGAMYSYAGQEQRAVESFNAALALAPDAAAVTANLALSYSDLGRHAEAIRTAERARTLDPEDHFTLATLGYVYGRAGKQAEAERALTALRAEPEVSPYLIATIYAGLGDKERTFGMLEQAVKQRDDSVPDLGVDPVFKDFRGDPRFARLLQKIGLGCGRGGAVVCARRSREHRPLPGDRASCSILQS